MENQVPEVVLPPQKPKSNLTLWVVVGIAILVVGIGVGLVVGKYFQPVFLSASVSTTSSTLTSSLTITPVEAVDSTANWKTYSNNTYQFSFRYPLEWQLSCTEPKNDGWLDASICQLSAPNTQLDHGYLSSGAYLAVGVSKPNQNYSNLKENIAFSVNQHGYKSSPKTINTIEGYFLSPPESPKTYSNFVFESKGYIININWVPTDENNPNYSTINQILSTFKFIE